MDMDMNMDDENAIWLPSSNFDAGRMNSTIDRIILHTTEGSFAGALGWLRGAGAPSGSGSSNRDSSSHYLVSADGTRIVQLVREADTAWAAGNLAFNRRGVNIEQEGYAARGEFSDALYATTGALVGRVARRHGIPLDRQHVIGHRDVPDPNNPARTGGIDHHDDPGNAYDFERLLRIAAVTDELGTPCRYFPETRHNVCDHFRSFWESYGEEALMTFGYPLSEAFRDTGGVLMQYFERARFEWRPGSGQNHWDVLLGRVGDEASESARTSNAAAFAPVDAV